MKTINFIIAIHNHQPVGNLDYVFADVYDHAYKPFLDVARRRAEIDIVLHYSGPLLEWLESNRPEVFPMLRSMIESGRLEIMAGGFYEPIMTMLPERDRVGQIRLLMEYLERRFGASAKGVWLAERVWEQSLTKSIASAGTAYVVVDDAHFKAAGIGEEELFGFYITEDQGKLLKVFPSSERLRYLIPFARPEETIEYLRSVATEDGDRTIVYADDGEKFGGWPGTYEYVYEEGWLDSFLELLALNSDWIKTTTFNKTIDKLPPVGKIYLADASYREMTEWSLPADRLAQYEDLMARLDSISDLPADEIRQFIRAGFWRNFKIKYPESNLMYAKMMEVSEKVNSLDEDSPSYAAAARLLYKGQCNCPYWHGVFGGLYFPHLRRATYKSLIAAENKVELEDNGEVSLRLEDLDFDGREEVRVGTPHLNAYFKPDRGGHLYELDVRRKELNVLATLAQRKEAYHRPLQTSEEGGDLIDYDWYLRETLIDHFFAPDAQLPDAVQTSGVCPARSLERGDFFDGEYDRTVTNDGRRAVVVMSRTGSVDGRTVADADAQGAFRHPVRVVKRAIIEHGKNVISFDYTIENLDSRRLEAMFGVELNFAMSSGNDPDRYYYIPTPSNQSLSDSREKVGDLSSRELVEGVSCIGIADEWLGIDIAVSFNEPAMVWLFPVETVFARVGANVQEEGERAFERVYQSSVVLPIRLLALPPNEQRDFSICLEISAK